MPLPLRLLPLCLVLLLLLLETWEALRPLHRLRRFLLRRSLRRLLRLRHLPLPRWQRFRQLPPFHRSSVWEARQTPQHQWRPLPRPHPPHLRFLLFRLHLRSLRFRRSRQFRDRDNWVG